MPQETQVSDVIWPKGRRERDGMMASSLDCRSLTQVASYLRKHAAYIEYGKGIPLSLRQLREIATNLSDRHDHAEPCGTEACPCFAEGWKARAETRDAFFAAQRARQSE